MVVVVAYSGLIPSSVEDASDTVVLSSPAGCKISDEFPSGTYRYLTRTSITTIHNLRFWWFKKCLVELLGSWEHEYSGPLEELIGFGGRDGFTDSFIGPKTAKKLLDDFHAVSLSIRSGTLRDGFKPGKGFWGLYDAFVTATKIAASTGVITLE